MDTKIKEIPVPIVVGQVDIETPLGIKSLYDVKYHNIMVLDSPKYIQNELRPDNYVREKAIVRLKDEDVQWPNHPEGPNGKILGAIILILSEDSKVLLVRNGRLWGLPKGARNYLEYLKLKTQTETHYAKTGEILQYDRVTFNDQSIESAEDNICRETLEETGIIIDTDGLRALPCVGSYTRFFYKFPYSSDVHKVYLDQNGTDYENDELLWVTLSHLERMMKIHRDPYQNKMFNHITYIFLDDFLNRGSREFWGANNVRGT